MGTFFPNIQLKSLQAPAQISLSQVLKEGKNSPLNPSEDQAAIEDIKNEVSKLTNIVKDLSESKNHDLPSEVRPSPTSLGQRSSLENKESFLSYRNSYFSNPQTQDFLTNRVWPKTRILLALASRMYKENVISLEKRGKLKDLIIAADPRLQSALNEYYMNDNRALLYRNLISLI